jgi:CO/xanthine dehydrogenase Mo-binding subunit
MTTTKPSAAETGGARFDALAKATGKAIYTEDLSEPLGVAYGATLRSPYSHARIRSIDVEKATQLPGVLAVVTRDHLEGMDPYIHLGGFGGSVPTNQSFIAVDNVRFDGDLVAGVAAESLALAQEAIKLIQVDYEELPVIFDPKEAIDPSAPLIHETHGTNVVGEYQWGWGDVARGFQEAERIFEDEYSFPGIFHHPMENLGGCTAEFRDGRVTLWAPIQHLFMGRDEIAELFKIDQEQVRIVMPYIGGGYGAKELKTSHLVALFLARKTGRPVKLMPSAEESFRFDSRHSMIYKVKTGVKSDGTLTAQEIELLVNEGAYAHGMGVTRLAIAGAWGPYVVPNISMIGRSIWTNTVPAGSFRSLGKAQVTWSYESHLDDIARKLGIEPMEFRVKNFMRRGHTIAEGTSPLDADYEKLLRQAAEAIQWDGKSNRVGQTAATPETGSKPLRGRGLSTTFRHGYVGASNTYAEAVANHTGRVQIRHTCAEIGQGMYTVIASIAAKTLGIPIDRVDVTHPDTNYPYSDGIASSRDTVCMGLAVQYACEDLIHELIDLAANAKGGTPDEWRMEEGLLWRGEQDYSIGELLTGFSLGRTAQVIGKGVHRTSRRDNPFMGEVPHWEVSVGAAEVEVDPETGNVTLLKYATVGDVGKAIHPVGCKSQLDGAAIMGLGNAMYEEMVYQDEQFLNGDDMQYRMPFLEDIPEGFISIMVENGDGPGPEGAKGMGQTGVSPIAPAIGNAVFDAVGARIKDLPITPEKVLQALGKIPR